MKRIAGPPLWLFASEQQRRDVVVWVGSSDVMTRPLAADSDGFFLPSVRYEDHHSIRTGKVRILLSFVARIGLFRLCAEDAVKSARRASSTFSHATSAAGNVLPKRLR